MIQSRVVDSVGLAVRREKDIRGVVRDWVQFPPGGGKAVVPVVVENYSRRLEIRLRPRKPGLEVVQ
jgi:hypothetical protein